MKLSTKGRYAMIALVDLAIEGEKGLVSLGEISPSVHSCHGFFIFYFSYFFLGFYILGILSYFI